MLCCLCAFSLQRLAGKPGALELLSREAGGQCGWGLRVGQRILSADSRAETGIKPGLPGGYSKNGAISS